MNTPFPLFFGAGIFSCVSLLVCPPSPIKVAHVPGAHTPGKQVHSPGMYSWIDLRTHYCLGVQN